MAMASAGEGVLSFDGDPFEHIDPDLNYYSVDNSAVMNYYMIDQFNSLASDKLTGLYVLNQNIHSINVNFDHLLN